MLSRARVVLALTLVLPLAAHAQTLALRRVMLSAAGVGYFEYAADISGDATLGLDVPLGEVDDVLASLVVFDAAGRVGGVSLPGEDGAAAAFSGVPFGPPAMDSPLAYLNALQGVELTVQGPRPMTGRLLRAERDPPEEKTPPRTRVSLLTAQGLQQFVLEEAESVQVADPDLRTRIGQALAALRGQAAQDSRHLTLRAEGSGQRTLRVAYVAAAPLWKAAYRLLLPAAAGEKARLQGWAVLENESGADWNGVDLSLQYGNPVTFRQALYRAYYVERPQVPVEVLGRILPGVDTGAHPLAASAAASPAPALRQAALAPAAAAATAAEGAESTVFHLPAPVVLGAGQSATLPFLDRSVPAERVGLVEEGRPHPLAAVRLINDTGASLPAGVLTLYDGAAEAAFAGDARLSGVAAGGSRLLAFAEDLRTGVDWRTEQATTLLGVTAAAGVLHIERRLRITRHITLTAPPAEPRALLIEIPRVQGGVLVPEGDLKPLEESATAWRLPVTLAPGETRRLTVHVDRTLQEQTALLQDNGVLARIIGEQGLSEPARAALAHVADLRAALAANQAEQERLAQRRAALEQDEDRLRKNLAAVPETDALHARLVRALAADEEQLTALAGQLVAAAAVVQQGQVTLQRAVLSLRI